MQHSKILGSRSERIVLQIEDDPANAEVVTELLARRSDMKLQTAINGPQGIEMACTLLPNVILLDMRMPGMSGLDVLPLLRGNPATALIPVIALSSNAYPREIKKCLDAGVFGYLTKPYLIDDLTALIDAAMRFPSENRLTTQ
jgi:CheY-like chemotaxis protein